MNLGIYLLNDSKDVLKIKRIIFCGIKNSIIFAISKFRGGTLAQLVEQWTENPCVPGSIPGGTTTETLKNLINR